MALGVPGRLRSRIISTFGTTRVAGRQPQAPAAFTPGEIPGTHFQRLSRTQGTWFCRRRPRKKSPVTPSEIDPGTVRLVAQRLNHYASSILRYSALNIEATCAQYWSTMHSILKQRVLNTEAQCTQYWSNVWSILKHNAFNIEATCAQYWSTALNQSTCNALPIFPSQSIPPTRTKHNPYLCDSWFFRALSLNSTDFCVIRTCSLVDRYLLPKQNDVTSQKTTILISTQVLQLKWNFRCEERERF
jgi:hypothetical protein